MDNEEKIKELEEKMLNYKRNYKQPKSISKNIQHQQVVRSIMKSIKKHKNKELKNINRRQIIKVIINLPQNKRKNIIDENRIE